MGNGETGGFDRRSAEIIAQVVKIVLGQVRPNARARNGLTHGTLQRKLVRIIAQEPPATGEEISRFTAESVNRATDGLMVENGFLEFKGIGNASPTISSEIDDFIYCLDNAQAEGVVGEVVEIVYYIGEKLGGLDIEAEGAWFFFSPVAGETDYRIPPYEPPVGPTPSPIPINPRKFTITEEFNADKTCVRFRYPDGRVSSWLELCPGGDKTGNGFPPVINPPTEPYPPKDYPDGSEIRVRTKERCIDLNNDSIFTIIVEADITHDGEIVVIKLKGNEILKGILVSDGTKSIFSIEQSTNFFTEADLSVIPVLRAELESAPAVNDEYNICVLSRSGEPYPEEQLNASLDLECSGDIDAPIGSIFGQFNVVGDVDTLALVVGDGSNDTENGSFFINNKNELESTSTLVNGPQNIFAELVTTDGVIISKAFVCNFNPQETVVDDLTEPTDILLDNNRYCRVPIGTFVDVPESDESPIKKRVIADDSQIDEENLFLDPVTGVGYTLVGNITVIDPDIEEGFNLALSGADFLRFIIHDSKLWILASSTFTGASFAVTITATSTIDVSHIVAVGFTIKPEAQPGVVNVILDNSSRNPATAGAIGTLIVSLSDGSTPKGTLSLKPGELITINGTPTKVTDVFEIRNNDTLWLLNPISPAPGGQRITIIFTNKCKEESEKGLIIALIGSGGEYDYNTPLKSIIFNSNGIVPIDNVAGDIKVYDINGVDVTSLVDITLVDGGGSQENSNITGLPTVQLNGTTSGDKIRFRIKADYKTGRKTPIEDNFTALVEGSGTPVVVSHDVPSTFDGSSYVQLGVASAVGGTAPYIFSLDDTSNMTINSSTGLITLNPGVSGLITANLIATDSVNEVSASVLISVTITLEDVPTGTIVLIPNSRLEADGAGEVGVFSLPGFSSLIFHIFDSPVEGVSILNDNEFNVPALDADSYTVDVYASNGSGSSDVQTIQYTITSGVLTLIFAHVANPILDTDTENTLVGEMTVILDNTAIGGEIGGEIG